jgi:hypothetical protein
MPITTELTETFGKISQTPIFQQRDRCIQGTGTLYSRGPLGQFAILCVLALIRTRALPDIHQIPGGLGEDRAVERGWATGNHRRRQQDGTNPGSRQQRDAKRGVFARTGLPSPVARLPCVTPALVMRARAVPAAGRSATGWRGHEEPRWVRAPQFAHHRERPESAHLAHCRSSRRRSHV